MKRGSSEFTVAAIYWLRLRAIALALRGPPRIWKLDIVGGHRPPLQLKGREYEIRITCTQSSIDRCHRAHRGCSLFRAGARTNASRYLPAGRRSGDLCLPAVWRHGPAADGRIFNVLL